MNPDLSRLQPYPFEKLASLFKDTTPPAELAHIPLSIGEPRHPSPAFVADRIIENISRLSNYPTTKGLPELRAAIANWATRRFKLNKTSLNPEHNVLPVNGTREAIFAFTQTVIDSTQAPLVVIPNPFYQIYEGASFLAGATPCFVPCLKENNFIPDFERVSEKVWKRCQLLFLCSPGNPTGAVIEQKTLERLIELSDRYNFVIASDECYSEIYFDESKPPTGLLEACHQIGRDDFRNCVVFHSLSKRSNLPGLRSGFVAGDKNLITSFLRYRTYQGCAMPVQHQLASIAAWEDEQHVIENRNTYTKKFDAVLEILEGTLDVEKPDGSFYLWPQTPIIDTEFSKRLFNEQYVTVLPGQYLSRSSNGINPGEYRIRMALVATMNECVEAAHRIKTFIETL